MPVNDESPSSTSDSSLLDCSLQERALVNIDAHVFEVEKQHLEKTRIAPLIIEQSLKKDEVILKIDKFALTANNISYGVTGDLLGYWRFFPTQELSTAKALATSLLATNSLATSDWGRLPVMGYADVIASNSEQIKVGERVWGFMPMATHLKILAGRINETGFSDISPYREGLAPLYAAFERTSSNPFYAPENEDFEILLRGLFTTSWLVDDFMHDNQYFGASQYLITSASSKTSIALAFAIKQRGKQPAIGITSAANQQFVESLGCYQQVISYDEISRLNAEMPSILVDMAGSQTTLTAIHCHFTDQLRYSCRIGATHHNDMLPADLTTNNKLPGAMPTFFFAPAQLQKRSKDWGSRETMKQIGVSLLAYIEFCRSIITIEHTTDKSKIDAIYQRVLSGKADASIGQIVSL